MARACGTCTLCCTVMKVDMEPPKPWHTPCAHCRKDGCSIYPHRPEPCQIFSCLWLASQELPGIPPLPGALRPDRCDVVMEVNNVGTLIAHCHRPQAWRREPMLSFLLNHTDRGTIMIDTGESHLVLRSDGTTAQLTRIGVDPVTNNIVYALVPPGGRCAKCDQPTCQHSDADYAGIAGPTFDLNRPTGERTDV